MTEFAMFPKTMAHPQFKQAISLPIPGTEIKDSMGRIMSQSFQGTPEQFPPVTVGSEREEEYYKAQGYVDAGNADPAAYVKALTNTVPETYVPQEYPKWVGDKLVNNAEEEAEFLGAALAIAELGPRPTASSVPVSIQPWQDEDLKAMIKPTRSEAMKKAWETRRANAEPA